MQNLRVLIIEDSEDDAELVLRTLRKAGYVIEHRCVASAQAMTEALTGQDWDLITSDHHMPDFSSDEALELLKQRGLDIPFFIISGHIGEDAAIEAMRPAPTRLRAGAARPPRALRSAHRPAESYPAQRAPQCHLCT